VIDETKIFATASGSEEKPVLRKCLVLILLVAAGCSRGGMAPVKGTVKLDGQPLAGASIVFLSQDEGGRDARGATDAAGVFHLSTLEPKDGALPGKYKVIVQPPVSLNAGDAGKSPEDAQRAAAEGRVTPTGKGVVLPSRYCVPNETILVQVIPAAGEIVFDLQSK